MSDRYQERLDWLRGTIYSSKGGWTVGRGVVNHGYSQTDDLVGKASFFQVMMLNTTGRLPEVRLAQFLEAAFICCSWPDPRIWCNQVGAFAGDARTSGVAAICAGTLASDSTIYGPGAYGNIGDLLLQGRTAIDGGQSVADFVHSKRSAKGRIPGFARPLAKGDDRVGALQALADSLGFTPGPNQNLAYAIHDYIQRRYGDAMNMGGLTVAFFLDQGFKVKEIVRLFSLLVSGGVHASFAEYRDQPVNSFLPLRCDDIDYLGVSERPVPAQ